MQQKEGLTGREGGTEETTEVYVSLCMYLHTSSLGHCKYTSCTHAVSLLKENSSTAEGSEKNYTDYGKYRKTFMQKMSFHSGLIIIICEEIPQSIK